MPTPDLERDLSLALGALTEADPRHGVSHLAAAFGLSPFDEGVHAAFEAIARRVEILEQLEDQNDLGTALLRSHALRFAGRVDEALVLLAQIAESFPDRGFETSLAIWLFTCKEEGRVVAATARGQVRRLLACACSSTIGLHRLHPGERELLRGFGDLAAAFLDVDSSPEAGAIAAGVFRRLGRFDDALTAALPGAQAGLGAALIARALTLRASGEGAAAAEAFAAAARLDREDNTLQTEQARSWFVAGDDARALKLLGPAVPAGDAEVVRLREACVARARGDRVALLDEIRRDVLAGPIELPGDATANLLRGRRAQPDGAAALRVGVSGWEAPSNRLLLALYGGTTDVRQARYSLDARVAALEFDPLSLRRGSVLALWVEQAGVVVQAVPAPSSELREAIARVAEGPGGMGALWEHAQLCGRLLPASAANEVAAAMVHPPATAAWLATLPDGLYRYQFAAACVLANLPQAWQSARGVFESLLFGPVDWASGAAITALGLLAQRDATSAREVRGLLLTVGSDLLVHSCEPRFFPLRAALSGLPCVPAHATDELSEWYRRAFAEGERPEPPTPAPPDSSRRRNAPANARSTVDWRWLTAVIIAGAAIALLLR